MYFIGMGNDSSLGTYSLTRGSTWWRHMKFPDMDQKSFLASPASGYEYWGSGGGDPSDSPRKSILLSPWIGRCRTKVDVLRSWSPPRVLIRPSVIGKINSPLSLGNITSFALSLFLNRFPMRPSFPTPQGLRNNPGKTFFPNWWILDWSFAEIGWYSTIAPNGITGPLNGIPNRLSYGDFPSDNRSWIFRRWQWHSMESAHHSLSRPACNGTADVPLSLYALIFRQSNLFLICVALTYNDSRIIIHKFCQIPRNCQCKWLWVSSSAPGTSLGSSASLEKFLFCTGMIGTTELPNLVPPRRVDECCVIHFLHWEFCDLQLSSHQNFPLWAGLYQHVFCKKPSLFSSSSRYRNLGLSESECRHYACLNRFHFCSRLHK